MLALGDRTPHELGRETGLPTNLLAHHLRVLDHAGLVERRTSEGDRRRRYVVLQAERLSGLLPAAAVPAAVVLFVCTGNSARSQFAAALWRHRTGKEGESAGAEPARRVDPRAVRAAAGYGIDLSGAAPKGYGAVSAAPALVVSVCDRAREAGIPFASPTLHWSVADPVAEGTPGAFGAAFGEISARIERLAAARAAA
jgi:protein-tyrosine-phosphatase